MHVEKASRGPGPVDVGSPDHIKQALARPMFTDHPASQYDLVHREGGTTRAICSAAPTDGIKSISQTERASNLVQQGISKCDLTSQTAVPSTLTAPPPPGSSIHISLLRSNMSLDTTRKSSPPIRAWSRVPRPASSIFADVPVRWLPESKLWRKCRTVSPILHCGSPGIPQPVLFLFVMLC